MSDERIAELEKHIVQLYDGLQGLQDLLTVLLMNIGKSSPEALAGYIEMVVSFRNQLVERDSMREVVIDQLLAALLGEDGVPFAKRRGLKLLADEDNPAE